MSGENRRAKRMLPVNWDESSTDELEELYAYSMATYFDNAALYTHARRNELLSEALLLMAQSQRSIYENTRISGENRDAKCMLPIDCGAEQLDCCSDSLDGLYVDALASLFKSCRL
ncbi:hypothetical protein PsorP6_005848 [Peronosclerospora sorghi]|uniref:Uncharacterized protein n=1 Tax=Peronosclerospora sorghi TaxID=230839 RepID=A0ACC0W579_9STRA|nr:hypothetical protein PsorP6_005848 [Peronosclerospora sorghi]